MEITGQILKYIYKNQTNNYAIFIVVDKQLNQFILCGNIPELEDDLTYQFDCEQVNHPKYGIQYSIRSFKVFHDKSKDGIVSYLSSNLFPGIGLISAEAIYDELGEDCLELIEKNPTILDRISKLSSKQKSIIYNQIVANRVVEEIFVKLYDIGLSNQMVMKLYEKYEDKTLEIIEANPYRLIYELEGFGFKKADELALKLGFKENDLERLKALLVYTLYSISNNNGLTYLSRSQLLGAAYRFALVDSAVTDEELIKALGEAVSDNNLIIENNRVYLPYLYYDEIAIAKKINALIQIKEKKYSDNLYESYLADFEKMYEISFAKKQKEAIKNAISNRISIITGGPGVGKTTIIRAIISIYAGLHGFSLYSDEAFGKILLCAPTGKASKRIAEQTNFPAKTIHRALGYNFDSDFLYNEENQLPFKLVIVDEASMIDNNLAAHLLKAISTNTKVVFVGDIFQLPSIGPGAFLKDLIDSNMITTTYLEEIYRQSENSNIVLLADQVKHGYIENNILASEDVKYIKSTQANTIPNIISIIEKEVEAGFELNSDIQVLIPMYMGQTGIDNVNKEISKKFNTDYSYEITRCNITFHEGDKVIQLKNSAELKIMNGDIGILKEKGLYSFDNDAKEGYKVLFTEQEVKLLEKDFENLNLAYATSIHKAQGSEYPVVIMAVNRSYFKMLKRKLLYTAISRAKKRLYIVGDINDFKNGLAEIEDSRQTSLASRFKKEKYHEPINDEDIPFDFLGEEDMEDITPYSFMV